MRIALLTDGIYPYVVGGMQKHSFYMAKYLAKRGVSVTLFHFIPEGNQQVSPFNSNELPFIKEVCLTFPPMGALPGHYIRESKSYSRSISSAFDQLAEDYDFIYAQGFTAWDLLQQKEKGRQLPPICVNLHGLNMFQMVYGLKAQLAGQMLKPFAKVQLQGADYVHSLGGKLTSILIEDLNISRDKIWEIPIGIDKNWLNSDSAWTDSISPRRNFVFIGRYDRVKGIKELNKILGDLAKEYDFSMSFIGPIPESHQVEHPHIKYFGLIKEKERIQEVLKLSDVLICPSHSEGMPTVIMEGMANRCAIIATDVGAVAHQVDSENGWLIEAKDEVALRKALIEAIEVGPEVLRAKQIASFERVKSFTWDRVIDQMLHFFQHHSSSVDITST